ncbi:2-amino-4-hydroxy-6-hydroxymethyldihydropteridine diphosphokinase [Halomonas halocynthiae]|uniref:2-amino-4-hydroxy-6- hydroxymethyldihydropteridine diphosphokinase n=1 Tax=Halomonas halocynthiae TaxID=176290 RepID=UPI00042706AB|nr:2-amino-4-hydroxy-6-hydroxymethyldihydropteridine diphosphokinase [Halomonas halocynthiae]
MALVTLSIGSNVQRKLNITACLNTLTETFGDLSISQVYESQPIGLRHGQTSANFYNLVVALVSDWPVGELQAHVKALEAKQGRQPHAPNKYAPIIQPLDIDVLSVGKLTGQHDGIELPRNDILRHAFVLKPLAELLPNQCHPLTQQRYASLWRAFEANPALGGSQELWPVPFTWHVALPHISTQLTDS